MRNEKIYLLVHAVKEGSTLSLYPYQNPDSKISSPDKEGILFIKSELKESN